MKEQLPEDIISQIEFHHQKTMFHQEQTAILLEQLKQQKVQKNISALAKQRVEKLRNKMFK